MKMDMYWFKSVFYILSHPLLGMVLTYNCFIPSLYMQWWCYGEILCLIVISFPYLSKKTNMANIQRGCCQELDLFFPEKNSLQVSARHAEYHPPYVGHHSWRNMVWAVATPDHRTQQSCCVRPQLRSVALSVWPKERCTCRSSTKLWLHSFSMRQHHMPQIGATSCVWCMGAQSWREVTLLCCKSVTYKPYCKRVWGSSICVSHAQRMRLGKFSLTHVQEELPVNFWN